MKSRNSPCSCGSGRKYKMCCLIKDDLAAQAQAAQQESELDEWLRQDFALGRRLLAEAEFNSRFPNGARLGTIHELPDGTTLVDVVEKTA